MRFPRIPIPRSVIIFIVGVLLGSFATMKFTPSPDSDGRKSMVTGVTRHDATSPPAPRGNVQGVATEKIASGVTPSREAVSPERGGLVLDVTVTPTRVIDGDTLELSQGLRVRLIGIDTPEIGSEGREGCLAQAARAAHARLVEGKEIKLERDVSDRDRYQRVLRYVWAGDTLVNKVLVEQGLALATIYPPDVKHEKVLRAAEAKAGELKLGRWGELCKGIREEPTAAGFESGQVTRSPAGLPVNEACTIKGNISARGEKIYHLEGCASYDKAKIEEAKDERWFCSEAEARGAGWRRAKDCP